MYGFQVWSASVTLRSWWTRLPRFGAYVGTSSPMTGSACPSFTHNSSHWPSTHTSLPPFLEGTYLNHDITLRGRKSNQIRLRCGCERCPIKLLYPCRQHLGKTHEFVDMGHQVSLVPLFLILEFSFFVGWLKVTTVIHIFLILSYGSGAEEGLELR